MSRFPASSINSKSETLLLVVIAVNICLLLNTLYFIAVAASPIIRDDGWYFLSSQIQPWIEQGFSWNDIFVKRGLTDHAQPLNKLFLYCNYRFFNLDFKYEAIAGFFGVFLTAALFLSLFLKRVIGQSMTWFGASFFVLAILTFTSLNSRELYSWPLVTFSYLPLFLTFLLPLAAWFFLSKQLSLLSICIAACIFVLIGDTASIISWLSLTTVILLVTISDNEISKKKALIWVFLSALIVASYFLIVNFNFIGATADQRSSNGGLSLLSINFYAECIRIVFSSSLVHAEHLVGFGDNQKVYSWLVAVPVFYLYLSHFFALLFKRHRQTIIDFLITFILVYATFSVVAIIVGRVPEYGVGYLNQPRYVLVYQLIPFALFMKYSFQLIDGRSQVLIRKVTVLMALPVMLCVQLYFATYAYAAVPWISKWVHEQTKAIAGYVNDPSLPTGNCTNFSSPICNFSQTERSELLELMMKNQLNLFNHEFQWKYRIFPPVKIKASSVSAWGPRVISVQSADGVWVRLSEPIISSDLKLQVNVNGKSVEDVVFTGEVITFYLPEEHKSVPGRYKIDYSIDDWDSSVLVGTIEVRN